MNITPVEVILPLVEFADIESELVVAYLKSGESMDIYGKSSSKMREEIAQGFVRGELECRMIPDSTNPRSPLTFEKRRVEFVQAGQNGIYVYNRDNPVFSLNAMIQFFHRNNEAIIV